MTQESPGSSSNEVRTMIAEDERCSNEQFVNARDYQELMEIAETHAGVITSLIASSFKPAEKYPDNLLQAVTELRKLALRIETAVARLK